MRNQNVSLSKKQKTKMKARPKDKKKEARAPGLFDRIARERRAALLEVKRIARLGDENIEGLKTSFRRIHEALGTHWDAVENTLHSTLLNEEDSNEIHAQVLEEREFHHICKLLANELVQISPTDTRWRAKFGLFSKIIELYVEKSKEHLGTWKRELGPTETKLLGVRFDRRLMARHRDETSMLH